MFAIPVLIDSTRRRCCRFCTTHCSSTRVASLSLSCPKCVTCAHAIAVETDAGAGVHEGLRFVRQDGRALCREHVPTASRRVPIFPTAHSGAVSICTLHRAQAQSGGRHSEADRGQEQRMSMAQTAATSYLDGTKAAVRVHVMNSRVFRTDTICDCRPKVDNVRVENHSLPAVATLMEQLQLKTLAAKQEEARTRWKRPEVPFKQAYHEESSSVRRNSINNIRVAWSSPDEDSTFQAPDREVRTPACLS